MSASTILSTPSSSRPRFHNKARMADLSSRILHPDMLLPIISFLPHTNLPSLIRASRYLHALVGPVLYADLPIPALSPSALCPHLSPIGSLFLSAGGSSPPSTSDLRAVLHDRPSRKRILLESARTLRLQALHTHQALLPIMANLRLNMSTVDTLHLIGGTAICHDSHPHRGCPFYTHLQPKVVIVESDHLALGGIGGLSIEAQEGIQHLVVKLRPSNFGMYPRVPPHSIFSSIPRITIVFTPDTYLDKEGWVVTEKWRPCSRSACGGYYWEDKPSFRDMLEHIVDACGGARQLEIVGSEVMDQKWFGASGRTRREGFEGIGGGWPAREIQEATKQRDLGCRVETFALDEWRRSARGKVLDPAPISSGVAGKGVFCKTLVV